MVITAAPARRPLSEPADHPAIWQLRDELPEVSDDDVFETVLSLMVGGLAQRAPRRCGCDHHQHPAS